MKFGPIGRVTAVVFLALLAVGSIAYLERHPIHRLASLFGVSVTVTDITPTPSPSPSPIPLSDRVPAFSLGTVVIQTFAGPVLVRTAAATVVTSDGLLITTSVAAPYGSGSFLYQVATAQGAVVRAQRVAYDAKTGLVLLKADGLDVGTVNFADGEFRAGDTLTVIGATFELSRYVPVVLPATVVYSADGTHAALSMDRAFQTQLSGARVVDAGGQTVGIFLPGGTPGMIGAADISAFIERYLSQNH